MVRIYYPGPLNLDKTVILNESSSRHLLTVLRLSLGAELQIFNGDGGFYRAELKEVKKKQAIVFLKEWIDKDIESPLRICLGQGISRGERMDFTVQKSVELGVAKIVPLITERCGVQLKAERRENRVDHWQKVAISASEQSGRCRVPQISHPQSVHEFLQQPADCKIICSVFETQQSLPKLSTPPVSISLLIGPEGGFAPTEVEQALHSGFLPLSLGPRVLRTETAALVAITLLQNRWGDLRPSVLEKKPKPE